MWGSGGLASLNLPVAHHPLHALRVIYTTRNVCLAYALRVSYAGIFFEYAEKNTKISVDGKIFKKIQINFKIFSRRDIFQKLPVAHGVVVRYG
jgi:hypothetical protein